MSSLLSTNLSGIDTSRPLIAACQTDFDVIDCKVEQSEKDAEKENLVIKLATKYEVKSTKAVTINPGFTHIERISLNITEKRTQDNVLQDLKRFRLACGFPADGEFGDPAQYIGRTVTAKVSISVDKQGVYDDQNRLRFVFEKK